MLIVGSGNIVHNLAAMDGQLGDDGFGWAARFDDAAADLLTSDPSGILRLREHRDYDAAVPTPDHFIPMLYLAGLSSAQDTGADVLVDGYAYGSLSMTSYTLFGLAGLEDTCGTPPTPGARRRPDTKSDLRVLPTLPTSDPRYAEPVHERGRSVRRRRLGITAHSAARTRILDAALDLIADHGVSGTSLQMIADAIGVTKAAVYHQFKTKDEIVLGVAELELSKLEDALEAAQAESDPLQARKVLLTQVIDMAVRRKRWVRTLQNDPIIVRLLGEHPPFRDFISELYGILQDDTDDTVARVSAALFSGAIAGTVINPLLDDIDDDTLRAALIQLTTRMLNLPD